MECNTGDLAGKLLEHDSCNTVKVKDAEGRRDADALPLPIFPCPLPEGGQGGGDPSPPTADSSRAGEGPAPRGGPADGFFKGPEKLGVFPGLGAYYDRPLCVHCPLSRTWGEKL